MESGPQGLLHPLWKVAQAWKVGKDKSPPTVTSSLRVALIKCMLAEWAARLDIMTKNEETLKKMEAQGWVKIQGENEPMWNYQQWNAQSRRLELDPSRGPISHTTVATTAEALQALVASEAEMLIHRFHSTRKLTETIAGDTLPFILSVAMRGSKAQQAHDAFNLMAGNAAFRLVGIRLRGERMHLQPLAQHIAKMAAALRADHHDVDFIAGSLHLCRGDLYFKDSFFVIFCPKLHKHVIYKQRVMPFGAKVLGIKIDTSEARLGMFKMENTLKRVCELVQSLDAVLTCGKLSYGECEKLRGRLQFASGQLFGRRAKVALHQLSRHPGGRLGESSLEACRFLRDMISSNKSRVLSRQLGNTVHVYVDASFSDEGRTCGIGGMAYDKEGTLLQWYGENLEAAFVRSVMTGFEKSKETVIFELEALAVYAALKFFFKFLKGKNVVVFTDNEGVHGAFVKCWTVSKFATIISFEKPARSRSFMLVLTQRYEDAPKVFNDMPMRVPLWPRNFSFEAEYGTHIVSTDQVAINDPHHHHHRAFAVYEKQLFYEKMIAACYVNPQVLRRCQELMHTDAIEIPRFKDIWMWQDFEVILQFPKPVYCPEQYWFKIDEYSVPKLIDAGKDGKVFFCPGCENQKEETKFCRSQTEFAPSSAFPGQCIGCTFKGAHYTTFYKVQNYGELRQHERYALVCAYHIYTNELLDLRPADDLMELLRRCCPIAYSQEAKTRLKSCLGMSSNLPWAFTFALRWPELFDRLGDVDTINACINGFERCFTRYAAKESLMLISSGYPRKQKPAKADSAIEREVQDILRVLPDGRFVAVPTSAALQPLSGVTSTEARSSDDTLLDTSQGVDVPRLVPDEVMEPGGQPEEENQIPDARPNTNIADVVKAKTWDALKLLFNGEVWVDENTRVKMCILCGSPHHVFVNCKVENPLRQQIADVFERVKKVIETHPDTIVFQPGDYNFVCGENISEMGLPSHNKFLECSQKSSCPRDHSIPQRGDRSLYRRLESGEYENAAYENIADGVYGGILEKLPPRGAQFCHPAWDNITIAKPPDDYTWEAKDAAKNALRFVQKDLRHHIGRGNNAIYLDKRCESPIATIKCDEGGWVNLIVPTDFNALEPAFSNRMVHVETMMEELRRDRRTARVRTEHLEQTANWVRPWAIRASAGQSVSVNTVMELDPSKFALSASMTLLGQIQGAYHATEIYNLNAIVTEGLKTGSDMIDQGRTSGRLHSYFGIFPPWDSRDKLTRCRARSDQRTPLVTLFVPIVDLVREGGRVTENGAVICERTVPFHMVKEMWLCIPGSAPYGKLEEIEKLLDYELEDEICTEIDKPLTPAADEMHCHRTLERILELLCELPNGPHDGTKAGIISQLSEYFGVDWSQTDWSRYNALYDDAVEFAILHSPPPTEARTSRDRSLRFRICPWCLKSTPSCLARCTFCFSIFISRGTYQRVETSADAPMDIPHEAIARAREEAANVAVDEDERMEDEPQPEVDNDNDVAMGADDVRTIAEPEGELDLDMDIEEQAEGKVVAEHAQEVQSCTPVLLFDTEFHIDPQQAHYQQGLRVNIFYNAEPASITDPHCDYAKNMAYIIIHLIYKNWPSYSKWLELPVQAAQEAFNRGPKDCTLQLITMMVDLCIPAQVHDQADEPAHEETYQQRFSGSRDENRGDRRWAKAGDRTRLFTFQRCCVNAPGPGGAPPVWDFRKESQCWPSSAIMRTCCSLRLPQLCASRNGEGHMEGCCSEEAEPAIRPGERRPEPWLKGCHQRLYAEEAILQLLGQCLGVPRLRPDQLGALVAYYHRTGDVLPNMVEIQEGLLSRKVDGLEMCAPSMMLARLLEVERDSISLPPTETRSALTNLRMFWERLEEGLGVPETPPPGPSPGHEGPWLLPGPVDSDWLNVTRSSIRNSFMRIDSQAKELESLAVYRTKHGFKVNVVLPVCGDKDDTHLDVLERVVLQDDT
ncbi:hypothetical protein AK812_SmicGene29352 [Symbiodinium microadriaticum]|uniref:Uncharacterized protein n=1 Tax=Symbiodinium microadriaticum TaxID=2951 RepID=A0A1Q9D1Y0_SYMMI|nr:hypothetical protein AK812_SmicGene29352 [Symbiodinium microadriaticum]